MSARRRVAVVAVAVTLVAALVARGMSYPPPIPDERLLLFKVNEERAARGIAPLALAADASALARAYSMVMAETKRIQHVDAKGRGPGERLAQAGFLVSAFGENIAYHRSASEAHAAFMGSPPHRANILDPVYRELGVGVVTDARGDVFVTQVFLTRLPVAGDGGDSPTEAFRRVADRLRRPHAPLLWDAELAAYLIRAAGERSSDSTAPVVIPAFVKRSMAGAATFSGDSLEPPPWVEALLRDARMTHVAANVRVETTRGTMAQYRAEIIVYRAAP